MLPAATDSSGVVERELAFLSTTPESSTAQLLLWSFDSHFSGRTRTSTDCGPNAEST